MKQEIWDKYYGAALTEAQRVVAGAKECSAQEYGSDLSAQEQLALIRRGLKELGAGYAELAKHAADNREAVKCYTAIAESLKETALLCGNGLDKVEKVEGVVLQQFWETHEQKTQEEKIRKASEPDAEIELKTGNLLSLRGASHRRPGRA